MKKLLVITNLNDQTCILGVLLAPFDYSKFFTTVNYGITAFGSLLLGFAIVMLGGFSLLLGAMEGFREYGLRLLFRHRLYG